MLKVIELFAGIGSQHSALERLGIDFEVIGISEFDKYAYRSYEAIHGKTKNYGDITKVVKLDYADFWTYSFPCQDISVAGNQKGITKETRSGLLYEVERLLQVSQACDELPKYLMLENVKNLVGKKFKADFERWIGTLDEMGYNTYWKVLNAKNYGVPQNRERVFAISIRKDVDTGYQFPEGFDNGIRLKDILESEVDEKYYLSKEIAESFKARVRSNVVGDLDIDKWQDNMKRIYSIDEVSPTLNTMGGGHREPKVLMPNEIHTISIPQKVKVRKHRVEIIPLMHLLRSKKICSNLTYNEMARKLDRPVTQISHWFRNDNSFSVPDPKIWYQLKELMNIRTNRFDLQITEFVDKDGTFEKTDRHYGINGIAPTITSATADEKIIEASYRIRKLTPKECWRLMGFTDEQFHKAQAVNSSSQLYKQAGNSIVVDVLYHLFKNLFLESDGEEYYQQTRII